eukprot:6174337-Pleurochrysis_carterae.AAC.1
MLLLVSLACGPATQHNEKVLVGGHGLTSESMMRYNRHIEGVVEALVGGQWGACSPASSPASPAQPLADVDMGALLDRSSFTEIV